MPTLAIDKGFITDLAKMEKPVAKRVAEVFDEFDAATHTGLPTPGRRAATSRSTPPPAASRSATKPNSTARSPNAKKPPRLPAHRSSTTSKTAS